ncbi:MAG: ABC transporter permease [Gemmatimonadaceae bacterium]
MITDILTIVWKEWREFKDQLFKLKRGGLSALIVVLMLGIVTPLQMGPSWISSPLMLAYWPILAGSMVSTLIADAIAGERERHTLETLLATRLPDSAILIGKVLAAVLYGYVFALMNITVGWIVLNVRYRENGLLWIPAAHFGALLVLIGLNCLFLSGVGVFVSLRASSVRQAQQAFGVIMLILFLGPALAIQAMPGERRLELLTRLTIIGIDPIVRWVVIGLAVAAVLVNAAALLRFRRGRLVLD